MCFFYSFSSSHVFQPVPESIDPYHVLRLLQLVGTCHVHVILGVVRSKIQLGPALTWGSQTVLIINRNCRSPSPPPPPPVFTVPPGSDSLHTRLRGNTEHRDGHTASNPAPHLGYELANQGLSTLVMGLMTMLHLTLRPFDRQGHRSFDSC